MDTEDSEQPTLQFHQLGLDDALLDGIAKVKWGSPTLIQESAIPLIIKGKDVLAKARTGSGKTGAFVLPCLQRIISNKKVDETQKISVVILAPSRELCRQIYKNVKDLTIRCTRWISFIDISENVDTSTQKPLLLAKPDIIISTPSRLLTHIKAKSLNLKETLQMLVIDEADLIFSFGYKNDVMELLNHFPRIFQTIMMSATMNQEIEFLKKNILHNPLILKLEEPELPQMNQLQQYYIDAEEEDKFVLICSFFKLKMIKGKTLIFVENVNRCYKVKLFLEIFGIASCVLNSEMPLATRCHILNQFNSGFYNIIIASDEKPLDDPTVVSTSKGKKSHKVKKDKEFGASRGIDFQCISNIINFDFPLDVDSYTHRVGRTARAKNDGTAISFVNAKEQKYFYEVDAYFSQQTNGSVFKEFKIKMGELDAIRYRTKDAVRAVTRVAILEARQKEIQMELMNSKKLKSYFEDNPSDLKVLQHDKPLHIVKLQEHLHDVPEYVIPKSLKGLVHVERRKKIRHFPESTPFSKTQKKTQKKPKKYNRNKKDPLKKILRK